MSVIEDTRKLMQDFIAPELRAISARMDALEKRYESLEKKVDEQKTVFEQKIDTLERRVEQRAEQRHELVMMALQRLVDFNELRERLTRLESKQLAAQ